MKTGVVSAFLSTLVACSSSSPSAQNGSSGATSGSASGSAGGGSGASGAPGSGSSAESGAPSSGTTGGETGAPGGGETGSSTGTASGSVSSSGSEVMDASGQSSGSGGADAGGVTSTLADGGVVPYAGTPFAAPAGHSLQIPGKIYMADYDNGGPFVAYCHGDPSNCNRGVDTGDWRPGGFAPYRPVATGAQTCGGAACDDNAGICHMNNGEPDNYAQTGAVMLDGTLYSFTAGTAVNPYDTYICYMVSPTSGGPSIATQWSRYTVQVTEAGIYSVGGQMGSPGGVTVSLDFGNGITTGPMTVPASPTSACKCPETYHSWEVVAGLGTVTFATPGTYVMTFTLLTQQFNPDFFVFTKM